MAEEREDRRNQMDERVGSVIDIKNEVKNLLKKKVKEVSGGDYL